MIEHLHRSFDVEHLIIFRFDFDYALFSLSLSQNISYWCRFLSVFFILFYCPINNCFFQIHRRTKKKYIIESFQTLNSFFSLLLLFSGMCALVLCVTSPFLLSIAQSHPLSDAINFNWKLKHRFQITCDMCFILFSTAAAAAVCCCFVMRFQNFVLHKNKQS